jgi:hypothetical protein
MLIIPFLCLLLKFPPRIFDSLLHISLLRFYEFFLDLHDLFLSLLLGNLQYNFHNINQDSDSDNTQIDPSEAVLIFKVKASLVENDHYVAFVAKSFDAKINV